MSGGEKGFVISKLVSADSDKGQTSLIIEEKGSNFRVNYKYLLQNVKRVSIVTVQFPNNFYNVIDGHNTFNFNAEAFDYKITVPQGFYTISRLFTVLSSLITAENSGHTLVFGLEQDTGRVFMERGTITGDIKFEMTSLLGQMGYHSAPTITGANRVVAQNLPQMQGLTKVYLCSNALGVQHGVDSTGEQKPYVLGIPITVQFGALNVFECKQDVLCEILFPTRRNLQELDFQLQDRNGEIVYLNGGNLKIEMRIWQDTF